MHAFANLLAVICGVNAFTNTMRRLGTTVRLFSRTDQDLITVLVLLLVLLHDMISSATEHAIGLQLLTKHFLGTATHPPHLK